MAHLWQYENKHWSPLALSGAELALAQGGVLRPLAGDAWVLLAAPDAAVRVNGRPLSLGIRCLRDKDEIGAGAERYFFSTENLARVEPFPGADGGAMCARCRKPLIVEMPSVRCPNCRTWCHERADSACWTYSEKCPLCEQATALDAGFQWEPKL